MIINNIGYTSNGDSVIINIEIPNTEGYEDLYITKIAIQDHLNYTVSYPNTPQFEMNSTLDYPYKIDNAKEVKIEIPIEDIKLLSTFKDTGMLFVYVYQNGVPGPNLPCGEDFEYKVIGAINTFNVYNLVSKIINRANGKCDSESKAELLDLYWKLSSIELALKHGDYINAIELYNSMLYQDLKKGGCISCNTEISYRTGGCYGCR